MCGFVSLYNKYNKRCDPGLIQIMTDIIYHRGPDSEGTHMDDHIGLGFRRLSIIDLAGGSQPMCNETGDIWIVFNGEIYNYPELRKWLSGLGHVFASSSDTESIIHLYEEVGFDAPKYLRGMFAFVIWDKRKNIFFGSRDHFGIKPLYWTETDSAFGFASEIKSLLEIPDIKRKIDYTSFGNYFTFQYVPEPRTMFEGIFKLPAGNFFVIQDNKIRIDSYWQPELKPDNNLSFESLRQEVYSTLEESVKRHTVCDVNWGAFLSSGVDSSCVVGLLSQEQRIKTFTVGFELPGYNELEFARRTANFYNTEHHEYEISSEEYLNIVPTLIWHQDEPVADPSAIALYFVAKLASQYVTVVLSGEGADEFFAGYNIYKEPQALSSYVNMIPKGMRHLFGLAASKLPEGIRGRSYLVRGSQPIEERFFGNALIFSEKTKAKLLHGKQLSSPYDVTRPLYNRVQDQEDITKMQFIDIKTWLSGNILAKADKMTMANSIELRVPFIDTKLFNLAATIPPKYEVTEGTTKYLLRQAMSDLLPAEIKSRKKLGFPVPLRVWLQGPLYSWARELILDSGLGSLLNINYALYMLEEHKNGRADNSRKLWVILVFILWHQIFITGRYKIEGRKSFL